METLSPLPLFGWWRQVNFKKSLYRDLVSIIKIILWGHCLNHHFWKCLNNHFQKWKTRKYNQLLSLTDHTPFYQSNFSSWLLFLTLPLILFLIFLILLITKPNIEVSGWLYQTHHSHYLSTFFKSVASILHTLWADPHIYNYLIIIHIIIKFNTFN